MMRSWGCSNAVYTCNMPLGGQPCWFSTTYRVLQSGITKIQDHDVLMRLQQRCVHLQHAVRCLATDVIVQYYVQGVAR